MIIVLGDLLADYSLRLPSTAVEPEDIRQVSYLELGPGGACNVAITAARLGLDVVCLGEVGEDLFGRLVVDSLMKEGIDASNVVVTPGAHTPVANVLVDERGEPAYLGYPGSLRLSALPEAWRPALSSAQALFVDGWAEHQGVPDLKLEALGVAAAARVPIFFDPGPGGHRSDNSWHRSAAGLSTILLATEREARRLSGQDDPVAAAKSLLSDNTRLVAVKRGPAGCLLVTGTETVISPGFPVALVDATGAGDSFDGAIIHGLLKDLPLPKLGALANAAGGAKVEKRGTGHNMPTAAEIRTLLERFGHPATGLL
jgi:ribokinase